MMHLENRFVTGAEKREVQDEQRKKQKDREFRQEQACLLPNRSSKKENRS